ncbi:MAG: glycosyltransferase family 2 protein [Fusobacteriaceae bacterium]
MRIPNNVSIVILSYNSEKWILETLDSVLNQTYKNIELIISDDNSTDGTIKICEEWIAKNKNKLKTIKILKAEINQGVTRNVNKGIKASTSEWIKLIAGDDILFEDCIQKNVEYCIKNNLNNLFSKVVEFKDELKTENLIKVEVNSEIFSKEANEQFEELLIGNFVSAPTGFFKKSLIESMNYFDEKYPMVEDYPMWLKLTENGIKLNFLEENTVYYRVHSQSLSNNLNKVLNERMYNFRKMLFNDYIKYKCGRLFCYREKLSYLRCDDIIKKGNKNKFTLIAVLTYLIDPYSYLKFFDKIRNKVTKK